MLDDEEFQYVVERREPDKICFLSGKQRALYDKIKKEPKIKGSQDSFMISALTVFKKIRSKRGVGGLATKTPRFGKVQIDDSPGPHLGIEYMGNVKESKVPFGSKVPRWKVKHSNVPGPGSYTVSKLCKTTKMCQTFGGPKRMKAAIETLCIPRPHDLCDRCGEICDGDYWHKDEVTFMCSICYTIERFYTKKYTKKELNAFKPIRNCSFMHQHEGTTAALRLMHHNLIVTKARKENYLSLFINPY